MSQPGSNRNKPVIALTAGDVAGIGPEVCVRACLDEGLREICSPFIVGHPRVIERAAQRIAADVRVAEVDAFESLTPPSNSQAIFCWNPADEAAAEVLAGQLDARAGEAAYQYLIAAATAALRGSVDAVTTAPLSKAALHLAGRFYPGHTEILAEVCGVDRFAMMLYLPAGSTSIQSPHGLGVAHVTLHTSVRSVPDLLTTEKIVERIELLHSFLQNVGCPAPRIGVCALNPHAGEEGLFGDEESRIISPAVNSARKSGIDATGPFPADTLLLRAVRGEFDGVAAMYHDQGHIALKLIAFNAAVNVTLGLPIVRTSPSHGTAFDIAWQGRADPTGMIEAVRTAARLARRRMSTGGV